MRVKICGLRSRADATAALSSGAFYGGLVFYPRSPRHLTLADAKWVAQAMPDSLFRVALTVDAEDEDFEAILGTLRIDMLQLHGRETPDRVAELRQRFHLPVMKAVGVADEGDLAVLDDYSWVVDQLLVDARPSSDADLPGGNGVAFDWRLIQGRHWRVPWMLAGGLTPGNVAEAVRLTGAEQVDVSSGVESAPGVKSPAQISAFIHAAASATASPTSPARHETASRRRPMARPDR